MGKFLLGLLLWPKLLWDEAERGRIARDSDYWWDQWLGMFGLFVIVRNMLAADRDNAIFCLIVYAIIGLMCRGHVAKKYGIRLF